MTALAGRTVLITGASSGVGRDLARSLAGAGAQVVACARRRAMLDDLVDEIEAAGGSAIARDCDVTDAASITAAFDAGEAHYGVIDSVIANAGINHAGPALKLGVDQLDAILAVNLRGVFLTAQEGARRMIAGPDDGVSPRRILFVASILGLKPQAGTSAYSATKAGVVMLAKSLALELARHRISVNALCPGYMPTDIVDDWFESDGGKRQMTAWPRRRLMPVAELEAAVHYLLSSNAGSVTGTSLTVDDGQSLT